METEGPFPRIVGGPSFFILFYSIYPMLFGDAQTVMALLVPAENDMIPQRVPQTNRTRYVHIAFCFPGGWEDSRHNTCIFISKLYQPWEWHHRDSLHPILRDIR